MSSRARPLAPAAALLSLFVPRPALAATERVSVGYDVAPSCPPEATFEAAVLRLTSRVEFVSQGERKVVVKVTARASGFVGDVTLGAGSSRTVDGATCQEVVDALALIAAIAIDPKASPIASPAPSPPPPPPPPTPPPIPPPPAPAPAPALAPAPAPALAPAPAPDRRRWRLDADGVVDARTGIAPVTMLGGGVGLSFASTAPRVFAPEVTAGFAYATSGPFDGSSAQATFKLFAAQLAACPVRTTRLRGVTLYPCAELDLGVVEGTGESPAKVNLTSRAPFWADVVIGPRGVVQIAGPLFAQLDLGAAFSLVTPTFEFKNPVMQIDSVATVGFAGSVGVGATIW